MFTTRRRLRLRKGTDRQNYLHVDGDKDGLSYPVADDAEAIQWPSGVKDKETYARESLSVGDMSITIYQRESLFWGNDNTGTAIFWNKGKYRWYPVNKYPPRKSK